MGEDKTPDTPESQQDEKKAEAPTGEVESQSEAASPEKPAEAAPSAPDAKAPSGLPDYVPGETGPATRTLNLVNPAVLLHVFRGHLDLGGDLLVGGDGYEFEGLTLSFPEIRYWGEFSIVRDPGAPLLLAGYLLGLAGLLLKLGGRRQEAEWLRAGTTTAGLLRGWGCRPPREAGP